MSLEQTEAIVLRGVDFSETSRIVTFLTPGRGKLACIAAGVRRPKSTQAPVLDTMNLVEIGYYWRESRNVQRLGDAILVNGYAAIKSNLEKNLFAAVPLEFALHAAQVDEPSEALFQTMRLGLDTMAEWNGPAQTCAAWMMVQLLGVSGFGPNAAEIERGSGLSQGNSGAPQPAFRLTAEERASLEALSESRGVCPEVPVSGKLSRSIQGFAALQLDCTFRSARVLHQVFG